MENNYIVYKLTAPDDKFYIGITKNFKRRLKEHGSSKYPIGRALRKYGKQNFKIEFLKEGITVVEALSTEEELVGENEVRSDDCYNLCLGGVWSNNLLSGFNHMKNPEMVAKHPGCWTTINNPMNNPESKRKMIESQDCKKVEIDGIEYYSSREAARRLNMSRQSLHYRLLSNGFPTYRFIG